MAVAALLFLAASLVPPLAVGAGLAVVLLPSAGRNAQAAPVGQPAIQH
jgi:hypothetical protein